MAHMRAECEHSPLTSVAVDGEGVFLAAWQPVDAGLHSWFDQLPDRKIRYRVPMHWAHYPSQRQPVKRAVVMILSC